MSVTASIAWCKARYRPGVESREVSEGVVLDYDVSGMLVGIDIDNASRKVDMEQLVLSKLPGTVVAA